jgi:hypothetical protein
MTKADRGARFASLACCGDVGNCPPRKGPAQELLEETTSMIAISRPRNKFNPTDVPSPAMIRRRAAAIQKHWSFRTRLKRAGLARELVGLVEIGSSPRRKGYTVE